MKFLLHFAFLIVALWATGAAGTNSGSVALKRLSLGDIGGWLELPIEMNGKKSHWLLDTGSNRNLVSRAFAKHHGLASRILVTADTALGQVQGVEVSLPMLRVGSLERTDQTALVIDLGSVVGGAADGLDGILGVLFFESFEIDLDLRNWAIEIRKSNNAPCPEGMSALALAQHRGLPVIEVVVDNGDAETLILDTGNAAGLIRIVGNVIPASASGIVLPGPARMNLAHRVVVGEQIRFNVPVVQLYSPSLKQALGDGIGGLAGTAFLDGARLLVDLDRRRACIEKGRFVVPGGFGLTLVQRDGGLYVGMVLPGSPAQAAGLRVGETIQRWGGGPAVGALPELWARVRGLDEFELVVGDEARLVRLRRAFFAPHLP